MATTDSDKKETSGAGGELGKAAGGEAGAAVGASYAGPLGATVGREIGQQVGQQAGEKMEQEAGASLKPTPEDDQKDEASEKAELLPESKSAYVKNIQKTIEMLMKEIAAMQQSMGFSRSKPTPTLEDTPHSPHAQAMSGLSALPKQPKPSPQAQASKAAPDEPQPSNLRPS